MFLMQKLLLVLEERKMGRMTAASFEIKMLHRLQIAAVYCYIFHRHCALQAVKNIDFSA